MIDKTEESIKLIRTGRNRGAGAGAGAGVGGSEREGVITLETTVLLLHVP